MKIQLMPWHWVEPIEQCEFLPGHIVKFNGPGLAADWNGVDSKIVGILLGLVNIHQVVVLWSDAPSGRVVPF